MASVVRWVPFLLIALMLTPAGASAVGVEGGCGISVDDAVGDVVIWPSNTPYPAPAIDLEGVNLGIEGGNLTYRLTIGGDPRESTDRYYRYWLGFEVHDSSDHDFYVDFRIGSTTTYDSASFVGPDEMGNPSWGEYPITWIDSDTMEVAISLTYVAEKFGGAIEIGAPSASADGMHLTAGPQGPAGAAPYVIDRLDAPSFVPLVACESEFQTTAPNSARIPNSPTLVFAAIALGAFAIRSRV